VRDGRGSVRLLTSAVQSPVPAAEALSRLVLSSTDLGVRRALLLLRVQVCPAYDERVKQIPCVCGYVVKGEDDDELWQNAQNHLRQDHPDLVGKVSRADLLAQAEEIPMSTS
jgi:Protein of unknown function (DUF1059)